MLKSTKRRKSTKRSLATKRSVVTHTNFPCVIYHKRLLFSVHFKSTLFLKAMYVQCSYVDKQQSINAMSGIWECVDVGGIYQSARGRTGYYERG